MNHHDQLRAHLASLTPPPGLPAARTRHQAAKQRHHQTITTAMHALARASHQLERGGPLRDGADPTAIALILYNTARQLEHSPQWADRVRPALGRLNPGFPWRHARQDAA